MKILKELGFETLPMLSSLATAIEEANPASFGLLSFLEYKNLITQPLTLSQFIPCKEGKPMTTNNHFPNREMAEQYEREYKQAGKQTTREQQIVDSEYMCVRYFSVYLFALTCMYSCGGGCSLFYKNTKTLRSIQTMQEQQTRS